VRNIAGRCVELRPLLLDAGVEEVLRQAGRHSGMVVLSSMCGTPLCCTSDKANDALCRVHCSISLCTEL
jgi:hypothetical protein